MYMFMMYVCMYCCLRIRLLVKEQAKRMKLADLPKHPWIVHHMNAAIAQHQQSKQQQAANCIGR